MAEPRYRAAARRRNRRLAIVALGGAVLLAAGCGTRLSGSQILAQNTVTSTSGAGSGTSGTGVTGSGSSLGGTGAGSGSSGNQSTGGTLSGGSGSSSGGSGATSTGGTGGTSTSGQTSSSGGNGNTTKNTTGKSGGSAATGANCTGAPTGTTITMGFIGYLSGFGASTAQPSQQAWAAWARMINASGGIHCHPVQLLTGDDGGSPSQDASIAQQFASRGAIALSWAATDESALASWAKAHSVPVIGAIEADAEASNPMIFSPYALASAGVYGNAQAAKQAGVSKIGILYCVESSALCSTTAKEYSDDAAALGLKMAYKGQISLTEPDYTANCLGARRSGVQLLFVLGDTNTEIRVAQSCARQHYNPIYELPEVEDSFAKISQLDGTIAVTATFPWFLKSGSPALTEYGRAISNYAPGLAKDGQATQTWGWMSAKVFQAAAEAATAHLKPSDKVTSQDILNGLWSLKNNTIGGLDPGPYARTFTKGKTTRYPSCAFVSTLKNGHWVARSGLKPLCK